MIFKAKRLDKITYEESMYPFPKTCKFLINTSALLVHCHLKKSLLYSTTDTSGLQNYRLVLIVTKCQITYIFTNSLFPSLKLS